MNTRILITSLLVLMSALHLTPPNNLPSLITPPSKPTPVASTPPAAVITYSTNQFNHWQVTAGFNHNGQWISYITPTNAQGAGDGADPFDTGQIATAPIEVFLADTNGKYINDNCAAMTYTGNPATDLACYVNEAKAQGYTYVIGEHAALAN